MVGRKNNLAGSRGLTLQAFPSRLHSLGHLTVISLRGTTTTEVHCGFANRTTQGVIVKEQFPTLGTIIVIVATHVFNDKTAGQSDDSQTPNKIGATNRVGTTAEWEQRNKWGCDKTATAQTH